jgi:DNA-binding GntR family transcriptional regulator
MTDKANAKIKISENEVYEKIKNTILEFDLKPGQKIRDDLLAKRFKCSRTPVRAAIIRLEQDGLLERIPHQGVFVKKFSVKEILDIHTVQELLEIPTAQMAIENHTKEDLTVLRDNIERCKHAIANNDMNTYCMESLRFHHIIFEASKNVVLAQILQNLREKLVIKSRIGFLNVERVDTNIEDHEKILNCLIEGDAE